MYGHEKVHVKEWMSLQEDPELVLSKKLIELNSARDCALLQASLWWVSNCTPLYKHCCVSKN